MFFFFFFLSPCSGRICLAGGQAGITRFLACAEAEFPVYFQRSVFILGDWGDCVSLKACPLPLPKCEMLRLGDAGLLLFVRPVCRNSEILGRRSALLLEVKNMQSSLNSAFNISVHLRLYP